MYHARNEFQGTSEIAFHEYSHKRQISSYSRKSNADRGQGNIINFDNVIATIDSLANVPIDVIIDSSENYVNTLDTVIYDIDPTQLNDTSITNLIIITNNLDSIIYQDTTLTGDEITKIEDLQNHLTNLINQNQQKDDFNSFVMFKEYPAQKYGFDELDTAYKSLLQYYQPPNIIQGKEQLIRWKSVKVGDIDKVYAVMDSAKTNTKNEQNEVNRKSAHISFFGNCAINPHFCFINFLLSI